MVNQKNIISYRSKLRPVLIVEFNEPQSIGLMRYPQSSVDFTGRQKENKKEEWIQWGNFDINFYFTTNKGKSWNDSIKYAKSWISRKVGKSKVKGYTIEWQKR